MLGAVVTAGGIASNVRWGWLLGILIVGVCLVLYLAQETVGLPGLPTTDGSRAESSRWLSKRSLWFWLVTRSSRGHVNTSLGLGRKLVHRGLGSSEQVPGSVLQQRLGALQPWPRDRSASSPQLGSGGSSSTSRPLMLKV